MLSNIRIVRIASFLYDFSMITMQNSMQMEIKSRIESPASTNCLIGLSTTMVLSNNYCTIKLRFLGKKKAEMLLSAFF